MKDWTNLEPDPKQNYRLFSASGEGGKYVKQSLETGLMQITEWASALNAHSHTRPGHFVSLRV